VNDGFRTIRIAHRSRRARDLHLTDGRIGHRSAVEAHGYRGFTHHVSLIRRRATSGARSARGRSPGERLLARLKGRPVPNCRAAWREIVVSGETLVGGVGVHPDPSGDLFVDVGVKLLPSRRRAIARSSVSGRGTALCRERAQLVGKLIDEMRSMTRSRGGAPAGPTAASMERAAEDREADETRPTRRRH
jgi:hypothetical protein